MDNENNQAEETKVAPKAEKKVYAQGEKIPMSEHPAFKGAPAMPNPGKLVSRLDHAVTISYEGRGMMIPPRAQGKNAVVIADINKLGALPSGVQCLKL